MIQNKIIAITKEFYNKTNINNLFMHNVTVPIINLPGLFSKGGNGSIQHILTDI